MSTADEKRLGWMQMYEDARDPNGFLLSFYNSRPGNRFFGEEISIDVRRSSEDIAVPVPAGGPARLNQRDNFTNKKFIPPAYKERMALNANDLLTRMAGVDPFTAAYQEYAVHLTSIVADTMAELDRMISRAMELQASQLFQTGLLVLQDENGNTAYDIDYKPKAAHFPTVGTAWSNPAADALADLEALAKLLRQNGKAQPDMLVMGSTALNGFLSNTVVKERLDNRRMDLMRFDPRFEASGATFYGDIWVGTYRFGIWAYPETHIDPASGLSTDYVAADKVIMLSSSARLDRVSAAVPLIVPPDPRVAGLLPGRLGSADFDVTPNVWVTPDGKTLMAELESRTLLVPVAIDTFGCLDITP